MAANDQGEAGGGGSRSYRPRFLGGSGIGGWLYDKIKEYGEPGYHGNLGGMYGGGMIGNRGETDAEVARGGARVDGFLRPGGFSDGRMVGEGSWDGAGGQGSGGGMSEDGVRTGPGGRAGGGGGGGMGGDTPPWWALAEAFPDLLSGMGQQGPGFDANGMPDYGYGAGYVDPNAGSFGWEDLWGPMAQQMEGQSKSQMARLREEFGTGAAGSARYSSPLMMAQEAGLAQTAADMNKQMSELQYQDRIAGDQRQRQIMQDMMGYGNAEQQQQQQGLDVGFDDWMRRSNWGMDQIGRFLGPNYQPDYLVNPGKDPNAKSNNNAATTAAIIGALGSILSDENIKHDVADVDNAEMLAKLKALKVKKWKYNGEDVDHIGPMAQDFAAQFGLGSSDKTIAVVDANGVTVAAMQEMIRRLELLEAKRKAA
ncbi:MAG TPA: tail fiber domain-containing protein [Anaerolineae bacterium]|nr:tail fiber domain-containing protein [Anaerolineae bacterium]